MNKQEAYTKLFILKDSGINVNEHINELAKSDKVPFSVEKFITLSELTNSEFLFKLTDKLFYKSIVESDKITDNAKGISSMITHIIIETEQNPDNKKYITSAVNIEKLTNALNEYLLNDNEDLIKESVDYVRTLFNKRSDK